MRTLTETFLYSWKFFHNSARYHWLLGGHMTSNNETVSQLLRTNVVVMLLQRG